MSESSQNDQSQPAADPVTGGVTAGALLKVAREAQGLHVGILAVMLKVPVHKLEALEADRFDELLDIVFTRALAASVCRVLKIDPTAVMAALPQTEIRRVKTNLSGLNTPIKSGRFSLGEQLGGRLISPLSLGIGLLVLGILAVVLWPDINSPVAGSSQTVILPESQTDQLTTSVMPALTAPTNLPADTTALSPASQDQAAPVREPDAKPGAASAAAMAILTLQARGTCWVEIIDADGGVQLRKIMEPGEVVQLDGALPLSVVLGRADEVDVSVRGQRLDVMSMSKANVARFEVK
jgi:cytoskeleton protein RodZ